VRRCQRHRSRGTAGTDGTSCTVTEDTTAGTKTITCDDGTTVTITTRRRVVHGRRRPDGGHGDDHVQRRHHGSSRERRGGRVLQRRPGRGSGTSTISCDDGTSITVVNGSSAPPGANVRVTDFHGEEHVLSSGEYAGGAKTLVTAVVTAATADAAGS